MLPIATLVTLQHTATPCSTLTRSYGGIMSRLCFFVLGGCNTLPHNVTQHTAANDCEAVLIQKQSQPLYGRESYRLCCCRIQD